MRNMHTIPTLDRPKWAILRQLAILIRDCSASMSGDKACDSEAASAELVRTLALPYNKDAFDLAIIDFSSRANVVCTVTAATETMVPAMTIESMTDITKALIEAEKVAASAPLDQARPVCVLFSDGAHNGSGDPEAIANRMKSSVDIVTVAFGADADEDLLCRIASSPQHFYRCRSGSELRMFFHEVATTLAVALNTRASATVALGQMHSGRRQSN